MCQIFENEQWENLSLNDEIVLYGFYHRYWVNGMKNQAFNAYSGKILDLKEKKERGLSFFYNLLNYEICKDVSICVVPSHYANDTNQSGIAELGRRLANDNRVDKVDFLLRRETIDKLAYGGCRNIQIHLNSIVANPNMTIKGDVVLLVDDVTTSGASLEACKQILLQNGAERVAMLALGQSI